MLLQITKSGLYCGAGDFHIDPWRAVDRALITHAHADHARSGSRSYLCAAPGEGVLRERLGKKIFLQTAAYGESRTVGGVKVSFHPAGHVLGSAQIRLEHRGEIWVVSGDYKIQADPTCAMFEPVRCHTFITECTFGLPVYRWPDPVQVMKEVRRWWRQNQERGCISVLFTYSLGKAQRVLASLDPEIGPLYVHRSIARMLPYYQAAGVSFPPVQVMTPEEGGAAGRGGLLLTPPAAAEAPWIRRLGNTSEAFVSGWMLVRGVRRRRGSGPGFALSDHADWNGLNQAIRETRAERVWVTHGQGTAMVRWLREQGLESDLLETQFEGETLQEKEVD